MGIAGAILIVCALFVIIMPEFWSGFLSEIGVQLSSLPWLNTVFRLILGLAVLAMGCILFSVLFMPTRESQRRKQ